MCSLSKKIALIIPCYNEAKRLELSQFKLYQEKYLFIFVNDCSTDKTINLLQNNSDICNHIIDLPNHSGKAEAVRQGMLYLKTVPEFQTIDWIGFWDADLATPLSEIEPFFSYMNIFPKKTEAVFGSRVSRLGSNIDRYFFRHILGRCFASAISLVLGVRAYDTQCGAKIFRRELINQIFEEPFISPLIFDVEILFRLKEKVVIECPLNNWRDVRGSSLSFVSAALHVIPAILKVRKKYVGNSIDNFSRLQPPKNVDRKFENL